VISNPKQADARPKDDFAGALKNALWSPQDLATEKWS
jgi:hypothetical protein